MSLSVGNGLHTPRASLSPTEKIPTVGDQGRAARKQQCSFGEALVCLQGHTRPYLRALYRTEQVEDVSDLHSGEDWHSCSVAKSSPTLCNL